MNRKIFTSLAAGATMLAMPLSNALANDQTHAAAVVAGPYTGTYIVNGWNKKGDKFNAAFKSDEAGGIFYRDNLSLTACQSFAGEIMDTLKTDDYLGTFKFGAKVICTSAVNGVKVLSDAGEKEPVRRPRGYMFAR